MPLCCAMQQSDLPRISIQYRTVLLMTCYRSNKCHLHYVACNNDRSSIECNRHNDIKAESVSARMSLCVQIYVSLLFPATSISFNIYPERTKHNAREYYTLQKSLKAEIYRPFICKNTTRLSYIFQVVCENCISM